MGKNGMDHLFIVSFSPVFSYTHTDIFPRRNEVSSAEFVGLDSRHFWLFLVFEVCGVKVWGEKEKKKSPFCKHLLYVVERREEKKNPTLAYGDGVKLMIPGVWSCVCVCVCVAHPFFSLCVPGFVNETL